MTPKLNQEIEAALIRNHGEPIEVEGEHSHMIYVVAPRDYYRQAAVIDREKLREAIIARRDDSRRLNEDWEQSDREVWESSSDEN